MSVIKNDTINEYTNTGATRYSITFEYDREDQVLVRTYNSTTNEYNVVTDWEFDGVTAIRFKGVIPDTFEIVRTTDISQSYGTSKYAQFVQGSAVRASDLNGNLELLRLAIEEGANEADGQQDQIDDINEILDGLDDRFVNIEGDTMTGPLEMSDNFVRGVKDPILGDDAVNLSYLQERLDDLPSGNLAAPPYFRTTIEVSARGTTFPVEVDKFTVGKEVVTLNGTVLSRDDYGFTTTEIVLENPAYPGDIIEIICTNFLVDLTDDLSADNITYQYPDGIEQTVQERLEQYVSVKDYGAKGDGVTDDTLAIQATIDSIPEYGTVYFPSGTYKINRDIILSDTKKGVLNGASIIGGYLQGPIIESFSDFLNKKGSNLAVGMPASGLDHNYYNGGLLIGAGHSTNNSGAWLGCDGATNWTSLTPSKNYNPQEFIIYNSGAHGRAEAQGGTDVVKHVEGSDFKSDWAGTQLFFADRVYKIQSVDEAANTLVVTELNGDAVSFSGTYTETFSFCLTIGSGQCQVNGNEVTYLTGDPFVPTFFSEGFQFKIDGQVYTVTSDSQVPNKYIIDSPPANGVYPFTWVGNLNNQLSTLRVQGIAGATEENINLMAIAGNNFLGRHYSLETGIAGNGIHRPLFMGSGSYSNNSGTCHQIGCIPPDLNDTKPRLLLGGVKGRESLVIFGPEDGRPYDSIFHLEGAYDNFTPSIRSIGTNANVGFGIDMQGNGEFIITQDFTRVVIKGSAENNAVNHLQFGGTNSGKGPIISSMGPDTDVDINFELKGNGKVNLGSDFVSTGDLPVTGYIEVKANTGEILRLAVVEVVS